MKPALLRTAFGLLIFLSATEQLLVHAQGGKNARYTVTDVGSLGGSYSFAYAINDAGLVAGGAATASQTDFISQTAFLWYGGEPINLGTLGGSACPGCTSEGAAASPAGAVAVISETASPDVNGEDFCGFGTFRQCLAAIWKNGTLRALPTLAGGSNSQVYQMNSRGVMIGFSEIGTPDPDCAVPAQLHRFEATRWASDGTPKALSLLQGDTVSFALSINDTGQAVGGSGLCSNVTLPPINAPHAPHAVVWNADGSPTDLGTPPDGAGDNVAIGINNQGAVVVNSLMSDGTVHAFRWSSTSPALQDLGTYPAGAPVTFIPCCNNINDRGQIAGASIDITGNLRAVLWENNVPVDLNSLVPADSPWYLLFPAGINNAGEIAVTAVNLVTFDVHGVVLSPMPGTGRAARGATKPPALSGAALELVRGKHPF
jgi:probable HAF family extracellular repeat protein